MTIEVSKNLCVSRALALATTGIVLTSGLFALQGCKSAPTPETAQQPAQSSSSSSAPTQINGEDVVVLKRSASAQSAKPEFLSATILPGRGMNLFQITANIPGRGETNIFFAPSLKDAAAKFTGSGDDAFGNASFSFGGAFLVPYPNRILGKLSSDGKTLSTTWEGKPLTLPANWSGKKAGAPKHAIHGLILESKAEDVKTEDTSDGQTVTGTIHAGNFGGYWPSDTDLDFKIELHANAVDAIITAKNTGKTAEPMGIGWHPYFSIPSGDRTQVRLEVPGSMLAEVNNYDDVFPTGKLKPVKGTVYDYTKPDGVALADHFLDDNFSHLTRKDGMVQVKLEDPKADYGINIEGLSPEIKTVQVYAPPAKPFVAIEEQFNFGDPFGKEWHGMNTGMVNLKPSQSTTWHVRLTLFSPSK